MDTSKIIRGVVGGGHSKHCGNQCTGGSNSRRNRTGQGRDGTGSGGGCG